jgi:hypothetical protein
MYVSPAAEDLIKTVSTDDDLGALLSIYESWSPLEPAAAPAAGTPEAMLRQARHRMGIGSDVEDLEVFSEVLDVLSDSHPVLSRQWHDAKLRALRSADRDKKLVTIGHVDAGDFNDPAIQETYLAAIIGDDEALSMQFITQGGYVIDQVEHRSLVRQLANLVAEYERKDPRLAARLATAVEAIFQHHPVVPDEPILSSLAQALTISDDPGSLAAAVDLHVIAIERSGNVDSIMRLLRSTHVAPLLAGVLAVRSLDTGTLDRSVCTVLLGELKRLLSDLSPSSLSPENRDWLLQNVITEVDRWAACLSSG